MQTNKKDHLDYSNEVSEIIQNKNFNELLNYTNFSLCKLLHMDFLVPLLGTNDPKIIKYLIKNMTSLVATDSYCGYTLTHFLFDCVRDTKLISYLIEKYNLDPDIKDNDGWRPCLYIFT